MLKLKKKQKNYEFVQEATFYIVTVTIGQNLMDDIRIIEVESIKKTHTHRYTKIL